jgi:AraC-like DNA-binding protein
MPSSSVAAFTDPQSYQAAIHGAQIEIFPTTRGDFRAELTRIRLDRLWLQRGRESLPRVFVGAIKAGRAAIGFLTNADQPAIRHCGMDAKLGEIIVDDANWMHRRTVAPCQWGSMSFASEDFPDRGWTIADRDLIKPSVTHLVRPPSALMWRLLNLHASAVQLANAAPDVLMKPEVARALENTLVHAMIACLTDGTPVAADLRARHRRKVIARFEELLAVNPDKPLYLADVCRATGTSERALQHCCHDELGIGPIQYLWLRRMHLAHRALLLAKSTKTTVTAIATEFGFWELGRFAVAHRQLFGETPSVSLLRRPQDYRCVRQDSPFALAASA